MKKIYMANCGPNRSQYRLIVNVTSDVSLGVELTLSEIQKLQYELKDILEDNIRANQTIIKNEDH